MNDRVTFEFAPSTTLSVDQESRMISGIAIPLGQTAWKKGKKWRFLRDSVQFGQRTPALHNHDVNRGVGKLASHEWTDDALRVKVKVSKTARGDEILALAEDGALGFSVGLDVPRGGAKTVGDEFVVSQAFGGEISLTPLPAYAGAMVESVAMQEEGVAPMGADSKVTFDITEGAAPVINIELNSNDMADAIVKAIGAQTAAPAEGGDGPQLQAVPRVHVDEELPYRFNGSRGAHSFVQDAWNGYYKNDSDARTRMDKFLSVAFVDTGDAATLTPKGFRPDLYVDERDVRRPLAGMISGGTLSDIQTFTVPKFGTAADLVAPHVEGVEPELGTFTATDQDVVPHALSGKVEITRELADKAGPQVDGMIWSKMLRSAANGAEDRIADMLAAFTDPSPLALNGVDVALADDLEETTVDVDDLDRFGVLAAEPALFKALATARDTTGRKLFPATPVVNADGTRSNLWTLDLGNGLTAVKVSSLSDSYLIERGAVYQWLSAPRKLNFDIQVKSVFLGFWQYSAEAIIDDAGVRKVTYTA
ncbi:phage major capsid protein [Lentzea terrae]|uniref:phage major capsid protein n=1 Tax=Lentzea terrae TaxID=2200761 RepID=UPI000DD45719|nr:hypothetical protein [Lentzea terrae]